MNRRFWKGYLPFKGFWCSTRCGDYLIQQHEAFRICMGEPVPGSEPPTHNRSPFSFLISAIDKSRLYSYRDPSRAPPRLTQARQVNCLVITASPPTGRITSKLQIQIVISRLRRFTHEPVQLFTLLLAKHTSISISWSDSRRP